MKNTKERICTIIQIGKLTDFVSRAYDLLLIAAIAVNIFIAIFDTFPQSIPYKSEIWWIECITVIVFSVDYLLRIWTADCLYRNLSTWRARLKFIVSWEGIIDLMSCVPFLAASGGGALRMFRIVRILRVFRIHHYADPLRIIGTVLKKKKGQLLSSVFIVLILMIASSLMMYNLEHDAQPDAFKNAFSGFWWAANTLLTVGYGDIVPITIAGKICGIVITFLGVGMVAIPTGILSAGFVEQVSRAGKPGAEADIPVERDYDFCPYCGKKLP